LIHFTVSMFLSEMVMTCIASIRLSNDSQGICGKKFDYVSLCS